MRADGPELSSCCSLPEQSCVILGKTLKFSFSIYSGDISKKCVIIQSIKPAIAVFAVVHTEAVLPLSVMWLGFGLFSPNERN